MDWCGGVVGWWIAVVVSSPTCHPARWSCRGFESRTHVGSLRWGEKSVCTDFGVHTALINLHPVSWQR